MDKDSRPKIYDCFTFFNELDLLEIRLKTLDKIVDKFVISEADKTHSGEKKDFIFEKNIKRFSKWRDKIIYIKVKMPEFSYFDKMLIWLEKKTHGKITRFIGSNFRLGKWKLENFQREELTRGLNECKEEDIIMVSDIDEIPKANKVLEAIKLLKQIEKVGFKQNLYNHFFNGYVTSDWIGTKAVRYNYLKNYLKGNTQLIRLRNFHFILNKIGHKEKIDLIKNAGWHFNNIGKKEEVLAKIMAKAEADIFNGKNLHKQIKINQDMDRYLGPEKKEITFVKIDKTFPKEIYKNQKKYAYLIK